jgi:hypothetical protein
MPNYSPYHSAAQEDRCGARVPMRLPAKLRASGSPGFEVTVYDLSISGFCCDAVTGMRPAALCWVTLPGLSSLQAKVIWNDGSRVGCAFDMLLNIAVYDRIVAMHGVIV